MPAKGTSLKDGERYNPINKELHKKFVASTGIDIDWKTFKEIIWDTNTAIAEALADDEAGVKLPEGLGHLIVTKYKSKKQPIDWVNSKRLKRRVPLLNLHSFGLVHHIKWFKQGVKTRNNYIFKFKAERKLARTVAQLAKSGKRYFTWENSDFWTSTKMERRFNKLYKKEQ